MRERYPTSRKHGGCPRAVPILPTMESLSLETGAPHAREEWEALAAAVLRKSGRIKEDEPDALVWERLTRKTLDGIAITPLGTGADLDGVTVGLGAPASQRGERWDVRGLFANPDAKATAAEALADLENGVTSVWLAADVTDVETALAGVLLDVAPVILSSTDQAQAFAALVKEKGLAGKLAAGTNLGATAVSADVVTLARELGTLALVADGTTVHDLGASDAQELGAVLAGAASYLRALVEQGLSVADAAALIELRIAATDEQFPTIAKFRAARRTWARMLELSGVPEEQRVARIHAVTSRPMMSKYDPYVNMLRTCVAAFAAGVGGADAVTVLPFDAALGLPDAFSRRIARNTSALLIDESHVAAVTDPAGGAYAVEKLTDELARAAWAELGEIEASGADALQARIDAVVAERDKLVALRKKPLTGLTEFPNLGETLPAREGKPLTEGVRPYGAAFEALRDEPAAEAVFLATMGPIAAHTARATFASNLFAAGGISVVNEGRHDDVEAVLSHYRGEKVVCLTGADPAYAEWGTELANRLREAGASWVIVAGKPLEGTDDNCAMGLDALDFLTRTREKLA